MRDVGRDFHETPPAVRGIGQPEQNALVDEPLGEPHRAALGDGRGDAQRRHRKPFALALVREEIEQHVPRGLAEKFGVAEQLPAKQAPADRRFDIAANALVRVALRRIPRAPQDREPGSLRGPPVGRAADVDMPRLGRGYDDMAKKRDLERAADPFEKIGCAHILVARRGIAARMIVDDDDRGCVKFERAPENGARIDGHMRKATTLELLVGNEDMLRIEEQYAEPLVGERSHRSGQIMRQPGVVRVDPAGREIDTHRFERRVARAGDKVDDLRPGADQTGKRLGRLRPELWQAAIFVEKGRRYGFGMPRLYRRDETCQHGSLAPACSRLRCRQVARASSGGRSQDAATCIVR